MKIYFFYLIKKKIDCSKYKGVIKDQITNIEGNECTLYAYTPEKTSELYFLSTRNMEIFFEKIVDMSREEYEEFDDHNSEHLLEYHLFYSKRVVHGIYKSYPLELLCTLLESDHVLFYKEEMVIDIISSTVNDNILDYLNTCPYKKSLKKVLNDYFIYDDIINKIYPAEDINYDNFLIDDLSLYIKLFSNTFKRRW